MKTYNNLYSDLCSLENLKLALKRARKRKSKKDCVISFEANLDRELISLRDELESQTYQPKPLKRFVIRDPKSRVIHASTFRDRVVYHAICNLIEPIFEKIFIYDSYASRKGKGTHAALKRFDEFKYKIARKEAKSWGGASASCKWICTESRYQTFF